MGYLANQNNEIIVDAILTKAGRERLSLGGQLNITHFSLSDDEIDYSLYNTSHPLGSDFFDLAIKNLPLLEPVSDGKYQFRYSLFTSNDKNQTVGHVLNVNAPQVFMDPGLYSEYVNQTFIFNPQVTGVLGVSQASEIWYTLTFDVPNLTKYFTLTGIKENANGRIPSGLSTVLQQNGGNTVLRDTGGTYQVAGVGFRLTMPALYSSPQEETIISGVVQAQGVSVAPSTLNIKLRLDVNVSIL